MHYSFHPIIIKVLIAGVVVVEGGGVMEEWGNWKYRTHIPRWFPSYPRLSWLLRLFLHLHSLPFPPFHIHLLYCYSMLGLLSFIFPPLIPLLPDPLSVLSSQYLFSPLLSVFLTPPPQPPFHHGATYIGLWLHTSAGDLCTGACTMCIRGPCRTATHYGSGYK